METEEIIQIPANFIKRIMKLDGGVNNKFDAAKIKDNEFADIQDMVHDPVGDLKLREGCAFSATAGDNYISIVPNISVQDGDLLGLYCPNVAIDIADVFVISTIPTDAQLAAFTKGAFKGFGY